MTAIRRPIDSMLNGVSQMAPSLRQASQAEVQINGLSSLSDGLTKRPATEHVAKVTAITWNNPYMFTYNRSSTEQFICVIIAGDLFVYDTDGVAVTVNFPHGKAYLGGASHQNIAVAQVEDKAYVVNKLATIPTPTVAATGTYLGKLQDTAALLAVAAPAVGDTYLIVGDGTIKAQGYYMQWNAAGTAWEEASSPGTFTKLNAALMPFILEYSTATGQFTFQQETWALRPSGDVVLAPDPDFVNREIQDVFMYRNRLGFLSGEYCLLSQSGPNYENFWAWTTTAQLDNDRIIFRSNSVRSSQLNFAVPFNKQLAIFSDSTQFILSTAVGQTLTPTTGSLDVSTEYAANSKAKPVTVGNSIFFPSEDSEWSQIRQYKVRSQAEIVNEADDITKHVPRFVPQNLYQLELAPNDDLLFATSYAATHRIYVYKFFDDDNANETLQRSWSYWELSDREFILGMSVMDSKLYVLVQRADGMHLIRLNLSDDPSVADLGFPVLLDMRVKVAGSYSVGTDLTTWTLPWAEYDGNLEVVKAGGFTGDGALVQGVEQPTLLTVTAPGDLTTDDVYIGVPYEFRYRFSEQFVRQSRTSGSPILVGQLHLRNFAIRYNETGYLRAEVVPRIGAQTYSYLFAGKVLGTAGLILGSPNIETGTFLFPVVADSSRVTIDLINDTHMPSKLVSAEWTGNFTSKKGV